MSRNGTALFDPDQAPLDERLRRVAAEMRAQEVLRALRVATASPAIWRGKRQAKALVADIDAGKLR